MHVGSTVRITRKGRYNMRRGIVLDINTERKQETLFVVATPHDSGARVRPVWFFRDELAAEEGGE